MEGWAAVLAGVVETRTPRPRRWATPGQLARRLDPATRRTPALDLIDRSLVALADGQDTERQMIFMPPQEGKSNRVSYWFPLWLLEHDPSLRIGIVSYSHGKAARWGRRIRRMVQAHPELGIILRSDMRAADHWETVQGGCVICVGIGGGLTGEPIDVLIVDDPVRGRAEAESSTYRDAAWDWWESVGATRLSARGRVVLMMTRWHADDLAGRLLKNEPGMWAVLRLPAIRNEKVGSDGAAAYDPTGELISVQQRRPGHFRGLQAVRSAYVWRSIYMQDPVAAEGNLFKRPDYRYWAPLAPDPSYHGPSRGRGANLAGTTAMLDDCWRFLTVDLAASTKTSADWTVASVWALHASGDLILLDRARGRIEEEGHWDLVRPLVQRWKADQVYVEEGFIGTTLAIQATKAGVPVQGVKPEHDKVTRALPATNRVRAGKVWFPADAEWLDEWCDELAEFPVGKNDDQVDTLAYAVRIVEAHWLPMETAEAEPPRHSEHPAIAAAYQSATGAAPNGADYNRLNW